MDQWGALEREGVRKSLLWEWALGGPFGEGLRKGAYAGVGAVGKGGSPLMGGLTHLWRGARMELKW